MPSNRVDSLSDQDEDQHIKKLDHSVRDMLSVITGRIFHLHNLGGSSHHHSDGEDVCGVRVITLTGSNTGASFHGEKDDKTGVSEPEDVDVGEDEDTLGTYVNSNFQAINNSIMMGGTYSANDPGVHAEITDFVEHNKHGKTDKKNKMEEKKTAESE